MKKNMGTIDRSIRLLLALVVVILYAAGTISGTLACILSIFATVFVVTSSIGYCPAYTPFKFSTCKKEN
jgi:hypothetical protein